MALPVFGGEARVRVLAFFVTLGAILAATAAFNLVVNPLGYYPVSLFQPLTWSSRQIKAALIAQSPGADVLIVGSSRSMGLRPAEVQGLSGFRAFNASVDSARVEDYLAMFRHVTEERGWKLRELLIGVDVEAFHDTVGPDLRLATAPEMRRWLPLSQKTQVVVGALKDLISLSQTRESLRSIRLHLSGLPALENAFQPDGWLESADWEEKFARGLVRTKLEVSLPQYSFRYAGFGGVDPDRARLFDELLSLAAARQIRVRAFLTPLHPALLEHLRRHRNFDRLHGAVLAELRALEARHPHVRVHDFTDVHAFQGSAELFADGAHMSRGNAQRIVAALYRN